MALGTDFAGVLEAARVGADWAVTELYRDLQPVLLRYLRGRAPGAAEDLASEVWLAVAQRLHDFDGDEVAFRAWLFTIARHRLIDHHRAASRRRTEPVANQDLPDRPANDDPETVVVGSLSAQAAVDQLLAVLPPDQADVVLLRVLADVPVEAVAKILGKSPNHVRVLQHRALRRLARRFPKVAVMP